MNGSLQTMKANYWIDEGDLRVIRPFALCREQMMREFADLSGFPVIEDNCPACFTPPQQRLHVKKLLAREEERHPDLFAHLHKTMRPLMHLGKVTLCEVCKQSYVRAFCGQKDFRPICDRCTAVSNSPENHSETMPAENISQAVSQHPDMTNDVGDAMVKKDADLRAAVKAWLKDPPSAQATYGPLNDWGR